MEYHPQIAPKFLDMDVPEPGKASPTKTTCEHSPYQAKLAVLRVKMLAGKYIILVKQAKFQKYNPNPTWPSAERKKIHHTFL